MEAWSFWCALCAQAGRRTPWHAVVVVGAELFSRCAFVLAQWLPWKMLLLVTGMPLPPGWPGPLSQWPPQAQMLALGGVTLLAYLLHLAADALALRTARSGGRCLRRAQAKTGLFNRQEALAERTYLSLGRVMAAAAFAVGVVAGLAAWVPPLLWVGLAWAGLLVLCAGVLGRRRSGRLRHWARMDAKGQSMAASVAFFLAMAWVFGAHLARQLPPVAWLVPSLLLYRQAWVQGVAAARLWRGILDRRLQVQALFLPGVGRSAPPPDASPLDALLLPAERERWLSDGVTRWCPDLSSPEWRITRLRLLAAGRVAEIVVDVTPNTVLLVKLYDPGRDGDAQQVRDLMVHAGGDLPAAHWLGEDRIGACVCHVMALPPRSVVLEGTARQTALSRLRVNLLSYRPSSALEGLDGRSHARLTQRLTVERMRAVRDMAINDSQREDLHALEVAWPALRQCLSRQPLQLVIGAWAQRELMRAPGTADVVMHHWAGWSLEPVGAGWPLDNDLADQLGRALTEAAKVRPELSAVELATALVTAYLFEFDRRCAARNPSGAMQVLAALRRRTDLTVFATGVCRRE